MSLALLIFFPVESLSNSYREICETQHIFRTGNLTAGYTTLDIRCFILWYMNMLLCLFNLFWMEMKVFIMMYLLKMKNEYDFWKFETLHVV